MNSSAPDLTTVPPFTQDWQLPSHWQPSAAQQQQFQQLYEQILIGNQQFNLTRITEPPDFWEKHLWDSLSGIDPWLLSPPATPADPMADAAAEFGASRDAIATDVNPVAVDPDAVDPELVAQADAPSEAAVAGGELGESAPDANITSDPEPPAPNEFADDELAWQKQPIQRVIDIGTGGGFPGFPVAIARPDWQVTLLDSTRKKINFLETVTATLALGQVQPVCDRAEAIGRHHQHRFQYDLALVRAVAAASTCAEYALPLLKVGGIAILYRGQWTTSESVMLDIATRQMGGFIRATVKLETPLTQGLRHCIYIQKIEKTPKEFPRDIGIAAKFPLPR